MHQSTQPAGATPNPPHTIAHSELIVVREGTVEFEHEVAGKMTSERAGPGDTIYVAEGTRHTLRNVGPGPATYVVVQIGGDVR